MSAVPAMYAPNMHAVQLSDVTLTQYGLQIAPSVPIWVRSAFVQL